MCHMYMSIPCLIFLDDVASLCLTPHSNVPYVRELPLPYIESSLMMWHFTPMQDICLHRLLYLASPLMMRRSCV
eukprot:c24834_g3_i2 orf=380-601(+)